MDLLEALSRRLAREKRARVAAESFAEEKTRDLFEVNRALEARSSELADARDLALRVSEAKTAFVANLSHELRTPLNAIIGYGELLREELEELELDELASDALQVLSASKYLMVLINDLLDLEKVEAGELSICLEEVELLPLVLSVTELLAPQIEARRNQLDVDVDTLDSSLSTDGTRLRQILHNLLSNASKFTNNGVVRVRGYSERRDGALFMVIEVTDTGIGIAPENLSRVFGRFVQADNTISREFGGTGLGLPLTRRLCQRLGGDIGVTSELGVGSCFRFWLPLDLPLSE